MAGYPNVFAIKTGDFNKDAKIDVAVTYYENSLSDGSHLQIFLGNGLGGFTVGQNVITNPQGNNIEITGSEQGR